MVKLPDRKPLDRTNDVPPPSGEDHACKCGKRMIVRVDSTNRHQGNLEWQWWCGCGRTEQGGRWHPFTAEESAAARWEAENAVTAVEAPVRLVPADCPHDRKTVADGGWTCADCGAVGTIPAISDLMAEMQPEWRDRWCDDEACKCDGCAPNKGGLLALGFAKDRWQAWVHEQAMREFQVWTEGRLDGGSAHVPQHLGTARAASFEEACKAVLTARGEAQDGPLHETHDAAVAPLHAAIKAAQEDWQKNQEAARQASKRALAEWHAKLAEAGRILVQS